MFPSFPLSLFLLVLLYLESASSAKVNVTIDDTNGDSNTGAHITYNPSSAWQTGQDCQNCTAKMDKSQCYQQSWHDVTFNPIGGTSNAFPGTIISASVEFTGSAVYVFCILTRSTASPDGNTDMTFFIDDAETGNFTQTTNGDTSYAYGQVVYANRSLSQGKHTVRLESGHAGAKALVLLDRIVYTTDDSEVTTSIVPVTTSSSSSSSSTSTSASVSTSSSTSTTSAPNTTTKTPSSMTITPLVASNTSLESDSTSKSNNTGTIIGAVLGSLSGILVAILLFWLCARKQARIKAAEEEATRAIQPFFDRQHPPPTSGGTDMTEHTGPDLSMGGTSSFWGGSDDTMLRTPVTPGNGNGNVNGIGNAAGLGTYFALHGGRGRKGKSHSRSRGPAMLEHEPSPINIVTDPRWGMGAGVTPTMADTPSTPYAPFAMRDTPRRRARRRDRGTNREEGMSSPEFNARNNVHSEKSKLLWWPRVRNTPSEAQELDPFPHPQPHLPSHPQVPLRAHIDAHSHTPPLTEANIKRHKKKTRQKYQYQHQHQHQPHRRHHRRHPIPKTNPAISPFSPTPLYDPTPGLGQSAFSSIVTGVSASRTGDGSGSGGSNSWTGTDSAVGLVTTAQRTKGFTISPTPPTRWTSLSRPNPTHRLGRHLEEGTMNIPENAHSTFDIDADADAEGDVPDDSSSVRWQRRLVNLFTPSSASSSAVGRGGKESGPKRALPVPPVAPGQAVPPSAFAAIRKGLSRAASPPPPYQGQP